MRKRKSRSAEERPAAPRVTRYMYKLLLFGAPAVQKANFLLRCAPGQAVSRGFHTASVRCDDALVKFDIWDTAAAVQSRYNDVIAPITYYGASAAIVAFNATSEGCFEQAKQWVRHLYRVRPNIVIALIMAGDKSFVPGKAVVVEDAKSFADEYHCLFTKTSAIMTMDVNEVLLEIAENLLLAQSFEVVEIPPKLSVDLTLDVDLGESRSEAAADKPKLKTDKASQQRRDQPKIRRELRRASADEKRQSRDHLRELHRQQGLEQKNQEQASFESLARPVKSGKPRAAEISQQMRDYSPKLERKVEQIQSGHAEPACARDRNQFGEIEISAIDKLQHMNRQLDPLLHLPKAEQNQPQRLHSATAKQEQQEQEQEERPLSAADEQQWHWQRQCREAEMQIAWEVEQNKLLSAQLQLAKSESAEEALRGQLQIDAKMAEVDRQAQENECLRAQLEQERAGSAERDLLHQAELNSKIALFAQEAKKNEHLALQLQHERRTSAKRSLRKQEELEEKSAQIAELVEENSRLRAQLEQERSASAEQALQEQLELEEKMALIALEVEENDRLKAQVQLQRVDFAERAFQGQKQLEERLAQVSCEIEEKERLRAQLEQERSADKALLYKLKTRVQRLEDEMQEVYILFTSKLKDFQVKHLIACGSEGAVFLASCKHLHIHHAKQYALKVMFNIFRLETISQVRKAFQNEYEILATLPFHKNIVRLMAFFYDRMGGDLPGLDRFDGLPENARTLSLFLIMDYLPVTLDMLSIQYRNNGQLTFEVFVDWSRQLAEAAHFLTRNRVIHRDMKLNNVLVTEHGQLKVCDFGFAIQTDNDELTVRYFPNMPLGGNPPHLSPEVLRISSAEGDGLFVAYTKQCVWELAVIMHELVSGQSPFEGLDQRGYVMADVPNVMIPPSRSNQAAAKPVAAELTALVRQMLSFDPAQRPTISQVLTTLTQYSERFPLHHAAS